MKLRLGEAAALLGTSSGRPEREIQGYSLDSRSLAPGELFFAIRGPRFDGHEFVGKALERGAAGAVVESAFGATAPEAWRPALVTVSDPSAALQALARAVRRRWGRRLVAVTGSTGKSTTKELLAAILSRRLRVMRSPGNLNNDFGLPLALLKLDPDQEAGVVEIAMSRAGEIARLARLAEPEIGVITNVAPVHLEFFPSVDAIADAKRELIDYLATLGRKAVAVLNEDDERVRKFQEDFPGRVLTFGFSSHADFRAGVMNLGDGKGTTFHLHSPSWEANLSVPLPGRHNIQNALAAVAAASLWDIPPGEMQSALAGFQNLHQRSEILTLPCSITIINDSYNSNPLAMERMLEALATWSARRRLVVAGEMLELGPTSPDLHRDVGRKCARSGIARLIAVQGDARYFLEGAAEGGMPSAHLRFFEEANEAGEFTRSVLESGDVVLVKGSRGVHLETAIELLKGRREETRVRSQESQEWRP